MKTMLISAAAVAALLSATPVLAGDFKIADAYARSAGKAAKAGAAFFAITNTGDTDDVLVGARSEAAMKLELHTHIMQDGVMLMRQVEGGFPIAAGETFQLQRGGDHVMFMGLKQPWEQGDTLTVTLVFESGEEMTVEIPVDLSR